MIPVPLASALSTAPNAGLPAGFRKRSSPNGDERLSAAGILFVTPDGDGLFVKRKGGDHAGEWSIPAGRIEQDEEPDFAARREAVEEVGSIKSWDIAPLDRALSDDGVDFVTFGQKTPRFDPILNEEHDEYVWAPLDDPPAPLHPGLRHTLAKFFEEEANEPEHNRTARELANEFAVDEANPELRDRSAFAFFEPHPNIPDHAQCSSCSKFLRAIGRCFTMKEDDETAGGDTCVMYEQGEPNDDPNAKPSGQYTKKDVGWYSGKVTCQHCNVYDDRDKANIHCDLFVQLNRTFPRIWKLNEKIKPRTCCNAWGKGKRDPKRFGPYGPIPDADDPNVGGPLADLAKDEEQEGPIEQLERGEVPKGELEGININHDSALRMALDRASVRSYDVDGHLHVEETNVCKASVNPYKGKEIPGWDDETQTHELGLEPEQTYMMLRPPWVLEKSVPTINGKPLLREHKPTNAEDHQKNDVVGSVGTTARWEAPFIKNGLTIWCAEDIEGIETREKIELSPGYHYDPIMEPGTYEGVPYDGWMDNIVFNHVALVEEGRQGPEVVVGDDADEILWDALERGLARGWA